MPVFSEEWLESTDEGIGLKRIVSGGDLGNFLNVLDLTVAVSRDLLSDVMRTEARAHDDLGV